MGRKEILKGLGINKKNDYSAIAVRQTGILQECKIPKRIFWISKGLLIRFFKRDYSGHTICVAYHIVELTEIKRNYRGLLHNIYGSKQIYPEFRFKKLCNN